MTRLRWESEVPREGMVLDNFPRPGYSVVDSIEDDPDAVWEMQYWGNEIPEFRPKTRIVILRPATDAEVEKENEWYEATPEPKSSLLERMFR